MKLEDAAAAYRTAKAGYEVSQEYVREVSAQLQAARTEQAKAQNLLEQARVLVLVVASGRDADRYCSGCDEYVPNPHDLCPREGFVPSIVGVKDWPERKPKL